MQLAGGDRKVDVRLPGKGNSISHGARPVHQIISIIKWIQTSRLSMTLSLHGGIPTKLARMLEKSIQTRDAVTSGPWCGTKVPR